MNKKGFIGAVEEFCDHASAEMMDSYCENFDFEDPDDFKANPTFIDHAGMEWTVPLCVSDDDPDEIAIDLDDAGQLEADGEGLYSFLWTEACSRLKKLESAN